MTGRNVVRRFTKRYPNTQSCHTALANYRWLAGLGTPLRLPRLVGTDRCGIDFEFIEGRPAELADLIALAAHLGDVHGAAFVTTLHHARLDEPFITADGHQVPDFLSRRADMLRRRLDERVVPAPRFDADRATALLRAAARAPAVIYKDCNPRNFLITETGAVTLDFDQVSLAPVGYDLAKLIVTLAMTHGTVSRGTIESALSAYNTAASRHDPALGYTGMTELRDWTEIHHILTSRYLGRHGYRYGWHTQRAVLTELGGG
ncbi:MAG: aminoglycoside phosphotransferase family protein [Actinomycetota bacterium]|nr:aminoglycoside phosphotransferase family protein [Actinomycetota bacterium]